MSDAKDLFCASSEEAKTMKKGTMKNNSIIDYSPYRALWAAVLFQAVVDLSGKSKTNTPSGRRKAEILKNDAWRWLNSDSEEVGSARWICSNFDLDLDYLRVKCTTRDGRSDLFQEISLSARQPPTRESAASRGAA
jgi:hypothetical protein